MIESILALFAVGTIGFWLLVTLASIVFIVTVENDHYVIPSLVGAGLIAVYWKSLMLVFNWKLFLVGLVIYALIGMGWSAFRWFKFVKNQVDDYVEGHKNATKEDVAEAFRGSYKLSSSYNKARIMGWITWWPWSMFWNLTQDFFTTIYDAMKGIYEKIARSVLEKAMGKLPEKIEKEEKKEYRTGF